MTREYSSHSRAAGTTCFLAGVYCAVWTIFLGGFAEHYDLWDGRVNSLLLFFYAVFPSGTTLAFLLSFIARVNFGTSDAAVEDAARQK